MNREIAIESVPPAPTAAPHRCADALRVLAMDAVQRASSGHPGAPMGMADIAEVLWQRYLRHNPANPQWPDRDRFVLSNGHASMLLYALLHLSGYDLPLDELKRFRQWRSHTPGHPEHGETPGVETTTGPLGQGLANAVGMALAEKLLAAEFNRDGATIVDHHTYVFLGDGCLMEGISHEACSLAGTLGLGKLVAFYDDNGISIDGEVQAWFTDDTPRRFEAYGWQVIAAVDGHDAASIDLAIQQARMERARPSLICCKTRIGQGSPNKAGTEAVHGAPLGADEVAATRRALDWPHGEFEVPEDIARCWNARGRGAQLEAEWCERLARYESLHPELAAEFRRRTGQGDGSAAALPSGWETALDDIVDGVYDDAPVATRRASQLAIAQLAQRLPELLGGSADLTGSNLTNWPGAQDVSSAQRGNYLHYGVREFGMSAIANGLALHGGFLPFDATFLVFSDYARNALRMSALIPAHVIHVFTHDSIGLGEDGPTHQSVEHAASLRLIPNLAVWRPCDTTETAVAWGAAVERPASIGMDVHAGGPSALLLSRQNLPFVERDQATIANISRGGYVLRDALNPRAVIIATGSEIALALAAQEALAKDEIFVRVVSMPCTQVFDRQDDAWRQHVLPRSLPRVAVEAGVTDYWRKYVGLDGEVVGIDTYGESAPAGVLFKHFGFTTERVVEAVRKLVG